MCFICFIILFSFILLLFIYSCNSGPVLFYNQDYNKQTFFFSITHLYTERTFVCILLSEYFLLTKYPCRVYDNDTGNTYKGYIHKQNLFLTINESKEEFTVTETTSCCCTKKTVRPEEDRKKLVNRLKRIEGQVRGIIGMLENDAYCNDILVQSAAVNAAVNAFNKELLAAHIKTCVARDIREGKDETIDELVVTLQKLMK